MPRRTVDIPLRYLVGPLLLVEIKRADQSCQLFDFTEVFEQTAQQAPHAFASFPKVNIIGVITALGDCWTYREYDRRNLSPSPTRSEYSDPSFVDSSPNLPIWPNNPGIDFGVCPTSRTIIRSCIACCAGPYESLERLALNHIICFSRSIAMYDEATLRASSRTYCPQLPFYGFPDAYLYDSRRTDFHWDSGVNPQ